VRVINASKRAAALALIALFILSCVPRAHARHHRQRSSQSKSNSAKISLTATVDFDADAAQDRATLQSNGFDKTIRLRFGDARRADLAFATGSADWGNLVAGDIDRDGDVDLVWVGSSTRDAVVLLNDGQGNFAAATDTSLYASELDDLFGSNDPSSPNKLKRGRKSSSLTSTSFHELGFAFLTGFQADPIRVAHLSSRELLKGQSLFVCYLRKRGPPSVLS